MPDSDLKLVVAELPVLEAALQGPDALSAALGGAEIAEGWEVFPEALPATRDALAADPAGGRWGTRLFLLDRPRTLVGWGGFKGAPADGIVELGYSVAPAHRGRGIAGAAVRAMLDEAFADGEVSAVVSHTQAEPGPSTRVLERAGFSREAEIDDPDDGRVWRWRIGREAGP